MLSEDFDKKIKEAADHHHPAYDEKAWSGMKKLLDRHMPEEKDDKRRYFFFLLLFLLLGGGAAWYFMGQGSGDKKNKQATTEQAPLSGNENKQQPGNTVAADPTPPAENHEKPPEQQPRDVTAVEKDNSTNADNKNDIPVVTEPVPADPVKTALTGKTKPVSGTQKDVRKEKINNAVAKKAVPAGTDTRTVKTDPPVTKTAPAEPVNKKDDPAIVADAPLTVAGDTKKDPVPAAVSANEKKSTAKNDEQKSLPVTAVKKEEKKPDEKTGVATKTKKSSAKKSSFFFSVSGGPDISYTGNDKPGRMQFVGGAGVGYTFKEKFTLRTGFYSARKVYTSSPDEYHPPDIFYTYYPNLQKVAADCKVYEIPLLLSYHFGQQKNHSWFASTGISTLLMKRETYDYYYKYYPTGPTVQREYTFNNENKHLFSVMTLSAGYQRSVGKRVSITAEPYFKLPLSGVGYGKVKLNSAGVLFSLSVKPFQRSDKK